MSGDWVHPNAAGVPWALVLPTPLELLEAVGAGADEADSMTAIRDQPPLGDVTSRAASGLKPSFTTRSKNLARSARERPISGNESELRFSCNRPAAVLGDGPLSALLT